MDAHDLPVIAFIGKVPYFWETQGLEELTEACRRLKEDYLLLFVANGSKLDTLKEVVKSKGLRHRTLFLPFTPPWDIPSIMKRSTCVVLPRRESTNVGTSAVLREAMAIGRCLILSTELYEHAYKEYLCPGESVLVVNPKNIGQFRRTLELVIRNPEEANRIG